MDESLEVEKAEANIYKGQKEDCLHQEQIRTHWFHSDFGNHLGSDNFTSSR
jgi:hypothetical protein